MKVLITPDSFKESLSASQVADAIEKGFERAFKDELKVVKFPIADGGEGTVNTLVNATGGDVISCRVTGPLGDTVDAFYGFLPDDTAVIEMAASCGLHLVTDSKRNPLLTTSRGLGELILAAIDQGAKRIILGLGGSATNDAGAGMLQALGVRLCDQNGHDVVSGGGALDKIINIDASGLDARLNQVKIDIACDVQNPLTGKDGATYTFGAQKGADSGMLKQLETNLIHFGSLLEKTASKEICKVPGAGAAGGVGAACIAFLDVNLVSGIDLVLDVLNVKAHLHDCDLVITGEGCMDGQSIYGKAPVGVARLAKQQGVPVFALAGSLLTGYESAYDEGIDAFFSVVPGVVDLKKALSEAENNIVSVSYNIAKVLQALA